MVGMVNAVRMLGLSFFLWTLHSTLYQCKLLDLNWHFDIYERATWEDMIFHRLLINNLSDRLFVEHFRSINSNSPFEKCHHCVSVINPFSQIWTL